MKTTTIIPAPTWGDTLQLLERKKSVRINTSDATKFMTILDAVGYQYETSEEGVFTRFTLLTQSQLLTAKVKQLFKDAGTEKHGEPEDMLNGVCLPVNEKTKGLVMDMFLSEGPYNSELNMFVGRFHDALAIDQTHHAITGRPFQTTVVSRKKLGMILDYIQRSNGVTVGEIAEGMEIAESAAHVGVKQLLDLKCISEGAVKYTKKSGGEGTKTGYFYENDLPKEQ